MSRLDKTVKIRWGAIFQPVCWLLGHRWVIVEAGTWADRSGHRCRRCGLFQRAPWRASP